MRHRLISAILAKNEASRYLPEVLDACGRFGKVVLLDDGSTDHTQSLCSTHPAVVAYRKRLAPDAWGAEASARAELWNFASEYGDWVLYNDADQILVGDPRPLTYATDANAWAFILYDCWDRQHYRDDGYWRAHLYPRPWLVCPRRVPDGWHPEWSSRGIHTGHLPANFPLHSLVAPPDSHYWLHLGYAKAEDRDKKLLQYHSVSDQLTDFEKAHALSIGDKNPTLRRLPTEQPIKVLVGGPVRKRADVLSAHLKTLAWQELPPRVEVTYAFINDYPEPNVGEQILTNFVKEHKGVVLNPPQRPPANDFSDDNPVTHQWTASAMGRVAQMRQAMLEYAVTNGFDYLWMLDCDLLCDKTVLASLLSCQRPIVSAVYWTRWHAPVEGSPLHAGPQVWLAPVYELGKGPFYPEWEFRQQLANRELVQVGGLGACTLIRADAIQKGVGYTRVPNFPTGGLWDGEDRHFSEWAKRLHVELWADAWPDIFHVYHPTDVERIPDWLERLAKDHPVEPFPGSLVSLRLLNLEKPIGYEFVRTLLGDDTLLPELAEAVASMSRGHTRIVRCHFPTSWPLEEVRGKSRLIEVTLVDTKTMRYAPVLSDEFHVTPMGFKKDAMQQTAEQNLAIAEDARA